MGFLGARDFGEHVLADGPDQELGADAGIYRDEPRQNEKEQPEQTGERPVTPTASGRNDRAQRVPPRPDPTTIKIIGPLMRMPTASAVQKIAAGPIRAADRRAAARGRRAPSPPSPPPP